MTDFDLIIVGAGPGGSNAAAVALRAGLRVAQLDAARFPRVKPCAGGMTAKAAGSLQLSLGQSVRRAFTAIEFNLWGRRRNRFVHPERVLQMVCRPEFDNQLVQQNLAHRHFTFIDGCRVKNVTYDRRFHVHTDRAVLTSPQLIGADGAHSIVNRLFRISAPRRVATAIEVNIERGPAGHHPGDDVPCLDYGAIEQGYGWVFPKDDHCSVGLYTLSSRVRHIRAQLLAYIESKRLQPRGNPLAHLEAARLPVGGFGLRVPPCPVYVVGDAGGFADALTGEGIYSALESGRLAAEIAVGVAQGQATHRAYYRRLWGPVLSDTAATFLAAREFYRNLDRGIRILQSPLVWRPLVQGGTAAATFCGSFLKGGLYLPCSLARGSVVRRSGWEPTS